ncbi:MAG TPA: hypothetical protein DCE23_02685 [Firmicutes bacterium]|nr:hypothetical protein [Bacillota bacterium]
MTYNDIKSSLDNSELRYRSILTIPRDVLFGLEIELESVNPSLVSKMVISHFGNSFKVKEDRSLDKDSSAEIATPPFYNSRDTWILLDKLGKLLSKLKPSFEHCSFQVNYCGSLLPTDKDKLNFLKLYAVYEDILYRFSCGEDNTIRDAINEYAYPIILNIKAFREMKDYVLEPYTNQKRYGICFKDKPKDLIEFRTPNGTINPILWQNYITTFYSLIMYSLSPKCNEKELDEYIDRYNKTYLIENYMLLKEEKAISLSKKLFSKSDDRLHFLHQYYRSN